MRLRRYQTASTLQTPKNVDQTLVGDSIYHWMIENVEDYAILLIDSNGIIQNWNKGAEKIKGYKPSEIIGKSFRVFYTATDRRAKLPERLLKEARENGRAMHEGWRMKKDGSYFWGSITITAIYDPAHHIVGFTKVTKDLTERKKIDDQIRHAILEAQEKERNELGEILHDNVSQILVTGILFVKMVEKKCTSKHLTYVKKYIEQAVDELRRISHRLNPSAELSRSLPEAITMLVDDLNLLSKTHFTFSEKGKPITLATDMSKMVFRVMQKLVSNILKYAKASHASLKLIWHTKELVLAVTDDGVGFDVTDVKKGLGLQNMHYRLRGYDGKFEVISSVGQGCHVQINIPLPGTAAQ